MSFRQIRYATLTGTGEVLFWTGNRIKEKEKEKEKKRKEKKNRKKRKRSIKGVLPPLARIFLYFSSFALCLFIFVLFVHFSSIFFIFLHFSYFLYSFHFCFYFFFSRVLKMCFCLASLTSRFLGTLLKENPFFEPAGEFLEFIFQGMGKSSEFISRERDLIQPRGWIRHEENAEK